MCFFLRPICLLQLHTIKVRERRNLCTFSGVCVRVRVSHHKHWKYNLLVVTKTLKHTHFLCLWLVSKVIDSPPLPYPFSMMKNCTKWMVQMRLWCPKLVFCTHLMWVIPPFSWPASISLMPSQVCLHALFLSFLHNHFYHYDAHFIACFCLSFGPFWYLYLVSCFFLFNFTL